MLDNTTPSCDRLLTCVKHSDVLLGHFTYSSLQPRELEIDPRTGMKNYIANGKRDDMYYYCTLLDGGHDV